MRHASPTRTLNMRRVQTTNRWSFLSYFVRLLGATACVGYLAFVTGCNSQSADGVASTTTGKIVASSNLLERALVLGKSTRADFTALVDAGGLENRDNNLWRGYKVASVEPIYDVQGKLATINLNLYKSWPEATLASNDNLRKSLQEECGSEWERTSPDQLTAKFKEKPRCRILTVDGGKVDIILFAVDTSGAEPTSITSPNVTSDTSPVPSGGSSSETLAQGSPPVIEGLWRCSSKNRLWRKIQFLPGGNYTFETQRTDESGGGSFEWQGSTKLLMTEAIEGKITQLEWKLSGKNVGHFYLEGTHGLTVFCQR